MKEEMSEFQKADLELRREHNALLRRQVELTEREKAQRDATEARTAQRLEANELQNRAEATERGEHAHVDASITVDLEEYGGSCPIGVRLTLEHLTKAKRESDKRFHKCLEGDQMVHNCEYVDTREAERLIREGLAEKVRPSIENARREGRSDIAEQILQSLELVSVAPGQLGLRGLMSQLVWRPAIKLVVGKCYQNLLRDGVVRLPDEAKAVAE